MKVGIIGLGLMGGSFGKTLVKAGKHTVYGADALESVMLKAEMVKAINFKLDEKSAKEIDLLVVAVTPDKAEEVMKKYLPYLKNGAIVTDFCGIKRKIVSCMERLSKEYPNVTFIGGHPMAGREFSGIDHSTATLFENASMILVNVNADIFTLDTVKQFFLSVGFKNVEICSAETHDNRIAFTSQLCHIVSNAFIKNKNAEVHDGFSAGSYKDMTRVARLNPEMWADLMTENADYLLNELTELLDNLNKYKVALSLSDREELKKLLKDGNDRKLAIDVKSQKKDKV